MKTILIILAITLGLALVITGLAKLAERFYESTLVFILCGALMLFFIIFGLAGIVYTIKNERIKEAEKIEDWYFEEKLVEDKDSLSLWEYDFWIDYDKEKVYIKKYNR